MNTWKTANAELTDAGFDVRQTLPRATSVELCVRDDVGGWDR